MPDEGRPRWDLAALAVSLAGFLGLIAVVWTLKRGGEVPRLAFLALLGMVCAPFYAALVQRPRFLHLVPSVVALFLLYPMAAPSGVVYYRDAIYNAQFARMVLQSGVWSPGLGAAYVDTYSYYPIGNVFLGLVIQSAGLPIDIGYVWAEPLVRLLAIPAAVYAIGWRLFGPRAAALGLLFYLGTASILFNLPVQQGIGTIFVALSLLALVRLSAAKEGAERPRLFVLFLIFPAAIVATHHLSSYVFALWLGAITVLSFLPSLRARLRHVHLGPLFLYYLAVFLVYVAALTYTLVLGQARTVEGVITGLIEPQPTGGQTTLGRTFTALEIGWLGFSMVALIALALVAVFRFRAARTQPFAGVCGLVAGALAFVTLPLLATRVNFVPLRIGEFANLILAPLAAWTVLTWIRTGNLGARGVLYRLASRRPLDRPGRRAVVAVVLVAFVFMGGNLAPLTMRLYFEAPEARITDTPLNFGPDSLRVADWAESHFGGSRFWGDQLANTVFAGFAHLWTEFGHYRIFRNATIGPDLWPHVRVGDYVVVDRYMTEERPSFLDNEEPPGPLDPTHVEKFRTDPHFALVYEDATWTVYRVVSVP